MGDFRGWAWSLRRERIQGIISPELHRGPILPYPHSFYILPITLNYHSLPSPFYYNHPLLPPVLPPISERKEMGGKWDGSRKLSAVDKNPREFSQSRELPSGGLISLSLTPSHLLPQCMCVCVSKA
jgi:hypothetical protein